MQKEVSFFPRMMVEMYGDTCYHKVSREGATGPGKGTQEVLDVVHRTPLTTQKEEKCYE